MHVQLLNKLRVAIHRKCIKELLKSKVGKRSTKQKKKKKKIEP